jgi:hypothetical protein
LWEFLAGLQPGVEGYIHHFGFSLNCVSGFLRMYGFFPQAPMQTPYNLNPELTMSVETTFKHHFNTL